MDIAATFKCALLSQAHSADANHMDRLATCRDMARSFALLQGGVAVISDILHNKSYIYAGAFGAKLGLDEETEFDSAFEDIVFSFIDSQDLLDSHILELRYIELIKSLPAEDRGDYVKSSKINIRVGDSIVPIIHQTRYLEITDSGSINISICTYLPVGLNLSETFDGHIFNLRTGLPLTSERLRIVDAKILTNREREVLMLLSKGLASKQIADTLNLSLNTVYRHRQNILQHLNVANTAEAVRIGLKMKLF